MYNLMMVTMMAETCSWR